MIFREPGLMEIVQYIRPGAEVTVRGDTIEWGKTEPIPDAEIAAARQALTNAFTLDAFSVAIQKHVDTTAKSRGYADGMALAGYSASTIPAWAAEAAAFISWRDQVWIYAYTELAKVQGGQRATPTIDGLIAELPAITWPRAS